MPVLRGAMLTEGDATEFPAAEKLQRNSSAVSRPWAVSVMVYPPVAAPAAGGRMECTSS